MRDFRASMRTFLNARGAPPPLALARRLRASLGPQALLNARGAPPPLALARRLRASLGPQALLNARGAPPRSRSLGDSAPRSGRRRFLALLTLSRTPSRAR